MMLPNYEANLRKIKVFLRIWTNVTFLRKNDKNIYNFLKNFLNFNIMIVI